MASSKNLIAVIPWSRFKWTCEAQYKQSLYTREEAIRYASRHGYNVVVEFEKRSGPLFDVFLDPDVDCQSDEDYEIVEVVDVLEESGPARRRRPIFRSLAGLFRRHRAGASIPQQGKALS